MAVLISVNDNGAPLERAGLWTVTVNDSDEMPDKVVIIAQYPALGRDEVIWDGFSFRPSYAKRSSLTALSDAVIEFRVGPDRGWPDVPTFNVVVIEVNRGGGGEGGGV